MQRVRHVPAGCNGCHHADQDKEKCAPCSCQENQFERSVYGSSGGSFRYGLSKLRMLLTKISSMPLRPDRSATGRLHALGGYCSHMLHRHSHLPSEVSSLVRERSAPIPPDLARRSCQSQYARRGQRNVRYLTFENFLPADRGGSVVSARDPLDGRRAVYTLFWPGKRERGGGVSDQKYQNETLYDLAARNIPEVSFLLE
jgi:hypothetical protein